MEEPAIKFEPTESHLAIGHPWISESSIVSLNSFENGSVSAVASDGSSYGSGLLNRDDSRRTWRRFSRAHGASFDTYYLMQAIGESLDRRGDEHCQRLVASDADYLPGLTVDLFGNILYVQFDYPFGSDLESAIIETLKESIHPQEIVIRKDDVVQTVSGQNLKAKWIEIDGASYRIHLMDTSVPIIPLEMRELFSMVGSLSVERRVLVSTSGSEGFAMQAAINGAASIEVIDPDEMVIKRLGATASKNGVRVDASTGNIAQHLREALPGAHDVIVLEISHDLDRADRKDRETDLANACETLSTDGLLVVINRSDPKSCFDLELEVAKAMRAAGRDGRVFARIAQPFDFPVLLSLPESRVLEGLILQVE